VTSPSRPPRNDEWDHLRRDLSGRCWWCGATANTHEHKYKQTDLRRMWSEDGLLWGGDPDRLHQVRSIKKSGVVRFGQTLCSRCNGARSQPFDRAYDKFAEYAASHGRSLWKQKSLDMEGVFGSSWELDELDLARYYGKHFGCRMVDEGFAPPRGLIEFLDGATSALDVRMVFVKDQALWLLHKRGQREGSTQDGLWLSPTAGWFSSDRTEIVGFRAATKIGYVGVLFEWYSGSGDMDSFFPHRTPALNKQSASRAVRVAAVKARLRELSGRSPS